MQFQLEDGTWSDAFYSSEVDEVGRFTGSASAGLPLDGNQNGIADSWEAQYSANGDPIDPDSDLDCMSGCGTMKTGDGFTAFEEYRGFTMSIVRMAIRSSGAPQILRASEICLSMIILDYLPAIFSSFAGNFLILSCER